MHFRLQSFVREKIVVPGQVKQITQQHLWSVNFYKNFKSQILRDWKGGYRSFITEKGYGHITEMYIVLITQPRQRPLVILSHKSLLTRYAVTWHKPSLTFPFIWAVLLHCVYPDLLSLSRGYGLPGYTDIGTKLSKSISHFLLVSSIITLSIIPKLTCQTLEK